MEGNPNLTPYMYDKLQSPSHIRFLLNPRDHDTQFFRGVLPKSSKLKEGHHMVSISLQASRLWNIENLKINKTSV